MRKLILKTALITLGSIVAVLCILYGVFALFFPLKIATFFDNLGMTDAMVSFYELNYENTGDIDDLGVLCVKVNEQEDSGRAKKYLTLLVESEEFEEYVNDFDKNNNGAIIGKEYFYGKLAIALKKSGGAEEFLDFALSSVEDGYSEFNCFYIALSTEGLFTSEELVEVRNALIELQQSLDEVEQTYLSRDLEFTNVTNNG